MKGPVNLGNLMNKKQDDIEAWVEQIKLIEKYNLN